MMLAELSLLVGVVGSVIVAVSLFMKERKTVHLLNGLGSMILVVYSWMIWSIPFIVLGMIITIINIVKASEYNRD